MCAVQIKKVKKQKKRGRYFKACLLPRCGSIGGSVVAANEIEGAERHSCIGFSVAFEVYGIQGAALSICVTKKATVCVLSSL